MAQQQNAAQIREAEQQRINQEKRKQEQGAQQGNNPNNNWVNPKQVSSRERQDQYLERNGLLNYQTKGLNAQEIAQRYAQAGVRTQGQWFNQNYGTSMPDPVAQPQVQIDYSQQGNAGSAAIQTPPTLFSPDKMSQQSQIQYEPASNGLVVKAKYQTAWLNGDPSLQQPGADPNQPIFASLEQAKAGQANWEDVATEERKKLLADPTFYKNNEITKYQPWMQQQILADPNFQWDNLPKWQKTYFELSSSPAGMGAAQGALMGAGNPGGAVTGAVIGWAGAKSGYDQNKEFWQQSNLIAGGFGLMNFLAEQFEKTVGVGIQAAGAAKDPNVDLKDVLTKEGWNAGANTFEFMGPVSPGWVEDSKKLMEKVDAGESLTWRDFGNFLPGVEIIDALINPDQHKGREYYLGAAVPVELQQNIYERFNQAREEIKAGANYREVMTNMQTGIMAQISDMATQSVADPLNVLPKFESVVGEKIATAGGNEVAATAFRQSEGLGEAARRYKTLVQSGQALSIDPNFKVDQMGAFSRYVAGINEQGQVKAGGLLPTKTGLLDPVNVDKTGWVKSMIEQTPQSRAQTGANMFYENVSALLTTFDDPHEAGKYLKALAGNDMETWAQLGSRFAESPEFYTVLPALKEFNTGKLDAIVAQWDLSLNNRDALTRISGILGEEPAKWLEDTAKRGTYDQDFQRLRDRVSGMNTPEARAILKDIDAGVITPEFLKQTVDLFTGEGALPWHPGQWKAMAMDAMGTHFDEWVTKRLMLDKSPEAVSAFYRTTALMKQAQSILLLGGSPGYAITNGLSNMVNRAVTGIYGYMTPNQINGFMDRLGLTPARFDEGVGIGGQVEQAAGKSNVKTEAITKAVKGKGPLTTAKENLAKLSRGMPMSKLSGWFESVEGKQGFAIAMKQFWSNSWRRGVGFSQMSADMVNTIKGMGIAPERIYAAIEAGMNQTEIEKALFGRFEGVQARSLINDAAQKTGLSASAAADMLEKVGVLDTLDTYLKGQTSKEGIQAAFNKANRVAQDFIDMQTGDDLKAIAESVKQRVGVEGAAAALDVVQKAQATYTDAWLDHYFRFGEVMNDLKLLDDPAQRSRAIDFNYEVSDGEFRRVTARNAANYKGIFDAWGMSNNPAAMNVLAAIGESDVAMANAYRTMREIRKGFFDKYRNDWENVDWDEWDANNRKIDSIFKQAFAEKKKAEIKQAAALGNIYESLYGPAAGEAARGWWEDVVAFNDEMVAREQEFRASLGDMDKDQRAAAKQQFYSETKRDMIVEMDRINAEGIARLERVIKRGNGGQKAEGGKPTPPTPLSPAETSPQIQSTNLEGGDAAKVAQVAKAEANQKSAQQSRVDEFNALMAAAEQRKAADTRAIAEHVDAVWEVASEYWAKGGNYERGVLGAGRDKFALLNGLRKAEYGGIPDLTGIEDPRLTPEIVRQILENRKAYKEAAGNQAANEAVSGQQSAGKKWDVSQINEDTTLLRAIALHGGIDLKIAKDLTGEKTPKSAPGVFTRKGVNIDEMARMLADDGYPIDLNRPDDPGGIIQATEMISKARAGYPIYPAAHDFSVDLAKAEAAYYDNFENVDALYPPDDPALWQTEFETAVSQGDLTKIWGMIGDYPETFDPNALDGYIRMADETAARVEAEGRDLEVAQHMARAEEAIAIAETRAEAVTTRQLLKEKFAYAFGLDETQAQAYMELSDAVVGHFAKITGEDADSLYSRYYKDVVKVEGEEGQKAEGGMQNDPLLQEAYHGSPYKFDQFSLDHMGSGEGAQAYGWGLYFAGDKSVAEWYRQGLSYSKAGGPKFTGEKASSDPVRLAILDIERNTRTRADVEQSIQNKIKLIDERIASDERIIQRGPTVEQRGEGYYAHPVVGFGKSFDTFEEGKAWAIGEWTKEIEQLKLEREQIGNISPDDFKYSENANGQLYKVEIPDNDYLLWDKPLGEQNIPVDDILASAANTAKDYRTASRLASDDVRGRLTAYSKQPDGTGQTFYHALISELGSDKAASLALKDAGINGIQYLDGSSRNTSRFEVVLSDKNGEYARSQFKTQEQANIYAAEKQADGYTTAINDLGNFNYVIFDDAAIQVKETFYQNEAQAFNPKGAVTFDADGIKATIHAFESGDFSTLIHENGHVFRRMMADVADRTNNPYIKADLATIEDWAGVKDGVWDRAAEEKFARGFEKYITDGKAPTPALVRAFESFKGWMLQIYKTITGSAIDVKLTDDVRRVFDRMLGAENMKIDMDAMLLQMNYDPKLYYVSPLGIPTLKAENFLDGDSTAFEALKAKATALKARMKSGEVKANTDVNSQPAADQQPSAFYSDMNFNAKKDYQNIPRTVSQENVRALSQWTNEQGQRVEGSGQNAERVQANLEKIQASRPSNAGVPSAQDGGALFQTADPVDSPAFQNWFGDSKVVDENGSPLVVYHGTKADFQVFDQSRVGQNFGDRSGFFFSNSKDVSGDYGNKNLEVYIKVEAPLELKTDMEPDTYWFENKDQLLSDADAQGADGLIIRGAKGRDTYVAFEPTQIKSTANRGTFDPADPNILFQEANQPFGAYDAASGFHPQSEVQEQGWAQHVRPLMDAMQEGAINQLSERPMDGATRDMSPEGQKMLRQYMKKVQGEMATTKLATVRWGEKQRDFAMLNYNKRYGLDRVAETVFPYQFYMTRSMGTYAARILDKPAMFSTYARMRNQQDRYERDIPERLRGKIKINAPWLPEWMGGGLYIDPSNLFFPAQLLKPFERAQQDKNYQTIEAERIMQEWAQDGRYSQADIAQAAESQSGTIWERASAEAKIRRESETANPLDFFSSMFGPAWYLSTPLNLAGVKAPGIKGDPNAVSPTPLGNTSRALDTITDGTWAEPVGNVLGLLGKFEDWGRGKLNLPTRGEYGEYYTKRQVANMVAEGLITPENASLAMIEKSGQIWDEAAKRVDMELAMRVPGMSAAYAALHSGPADGAKAFIPSLFGAGLLPAGELEYRGLKQEWNDAWKKADAGDKTAITDFFEEHPEYEAYLAKGKDGDELLKSFLIGQIWDGYMELGTTNQKQARAEMGDLFAQSFLDKETRSYDTLDIETLTAWARMLNKKTPTPLSATQTSPQMANNLGGTNTPSLDLYSPSVTAITDQYFEQRKERFPNYYEQQAGYYALPKSERAAYLMKNPDLKKYWDWKDGWYDSYPQYKPIFNGQAFKTVDTSSWPPALEDFVRTYAYTGKRMPSGAYSALQQVWIMEGEPMGDFETWVDSQVVPAMMYQGE